MEVNLALPLLKLLVSKAVHKRGLLRLDTSKFLLTKDYCL